MSENLRGEAPRSENLDGLLLLLAAVRREGRNPIVIRFDSYIPEMGTDVIRVGPETWDAWIEHQTRD